MVANLKPHLERHKALIVSIACFTLLLVVLSVAASRRSASRVEAEVKEPLEATPSSATTPTSVTAPTPKKLELGGHPADNQLPKKIEIGKNLVVRLQGNELKIYEALKLEVRTPAEYQFFSRLMRLAEKAIDNNNLDETKSYDAILLMLNSTLGLNRNYPTVVQCISVRTALAVAEEEGGKYQRRQALKRELNNLDHIFDRISRHLDYLEEAKK